MSTLTAASRQWFSRPDDERFLNLTDMLAFSKASRQLSREQVVSTREISARPFEDNVGLGFEVRGEIVTPTNWAFGQIAQRANAPAQYLRKLPAPLAADCINYGLLEQDATDTGILTGLDTAKAFTGPNYGRIWNSEILENVVQRFGNGVDGKFRVPGEFGKAVVVNKSNTTLYASDRDMFIFLADEENRVEIQNRRGSETGSLARGFFMWNSEVGSQTFGIAAFLFDYVCMNRMVWGAREYKEIRIRHTASAPWKMLEEVTPVIDAYSRSSTGSLVSAIESARNSRFDDENKMTEFLNNRFTKGQAVAIKNTHRAEEGRPIETLWDAATGITAYARGIQHQDVRVGFERQAGQVLDMAA